MNEFYEKEKCTFVNSTNKWKTKFDPENYKSKNFSEEIIDAKSNKVILKAGEKINFLQAKKLFNDGLKEVLVSSDYLRGKFLHKDLKLGEDEFKIGTELNDTIIQKILNNKVESSDLTKTNTINKGPYILQTIINDKNDNKNDAISEIYKVLRPGEPPTIEIASQIFNNLFFSSDRYDLSDVGRVK